MNKTIIVCGSPGSGKSWYGRKLSTELGAVLLDIDTVSERLVRAGLRLGDHDQDDRDSNLFKSTFRQPIYETLFDIARHNLPLNNIIIVGPFTQELRNPDWPSELSHLLGSSVEIHYIYCAPEIRKVRLANRANPRDRAKLRDWPQHLRYYGTETPPEFPHVFIDTSNVQQS